MPQEDHDDDRTRSYIAITAGSTIKHYRILDKIGAGGMGEVFLAEDTKLHRRVALKFLPGRSAENEDLKARFMREAQAAAVLEHQNIIVVHEVGEYRGRPYIAMQHLPGEPLRDIIKTRRITPREVVIMALQICRGLGKAHEAEIVHRDIKPSNIMIDPDGQVKILDFGLAAFRGGHDLTKTGSTLGTIGYMSPEQVQGNPADHRSDIFSLGIVLYEMLTGRSPFRKDSEAATSHAIVHDNPDPAARFTSDMPTGLQSILDKCLEKDRGLRYQHVDDLLADLKRVKREIDSGISTPRIQVGKSRLFLKNSLLGIMVIVALVLVLGYLFPEYRHKAMRWVGLKKISTDMHLAILPFEDIGSSNQTFCDGLLETLTSKIVQMEQYAGGMRVVPASDVRKEGVTCARDARKAFGVTHIVAGSVMHIGDSMQVIIYLADAKTERLVHSKEVAGSRTDHFALQDSTIWELAEMLEIYLRPEDRLFLMAGGTKAPEAYDLYLMGRGYLHRSEIVENIDTGVGLFHQALGRDPNFGLAYAGLGEAYWMKYNALKDPMYLTRAEDNCRHAIMLDDQLTNTYLIKGKIQNQNGLYEEAIKDFGRALELDSTSHIAYHGLAKAYYGLKLIEEAEANYQKAVEIKPDYYRGYRDFLLFYIYQGRNDDALALLENVIALEPKGFVFRNNLGGLYYMIGRYSDAKIMWEKSLDIKPNYGAYSNLGFMYQMDGRHHEAAEMYEQALILDSSDYRVVGNLASNYYWIPRQREKSLAAYEKAAKMAETKLEINPRSLEILTDLTGYYATLAKRDEAFARGQRALTLEPYNWDVLMRVGIAYEVLGDRDSALVLLKKSVENGCPAEYLENLPELKELRYDPRYKSLLPSGTKAEKEL